MFGELVRGHRARLGFTQEELAGKTGLSARHIREIEAGRISTPRPATVRLLAGAFGLTGADRDRFCAAAAGQPAWPTGPAVPAQLPLDVRGFTGRDVELAALDALIAGTDEPATAVVISAVSGTAGVGKTALAVHWAHRVRDQYPDGQLYVNLRGFNPGGPVMTPAEAIRRFLDALNVPPQRIPTDLDAQTTFYRTLLAERRMLILLDNARDPEQVRPLLPGSPDCLVLITSRNQLTGLVAAEAAHLLPLDLLTVDEARDLLIRRLSADRVAAEPQAVNEIITRCARLPLALAVVAARASGHPNLPLTALADELRHTDNRLDVLTTGDTVTDVRAVFSWSYQTLSDDSARLFRLLGLHPGPDTSVAAAASLAALPVDQVRPLLKELVGNHLIHEHVPGRYTFHDLLRAYATDLAHTTDTDRQRHDATHRILDHYLHTAYTADRLLNPTRDPLTLNPPQPGSTPEKLADHKQAMAWFNIEHLVLLTAVNYAAINRFDIHTWQLAWSLTTFLQRRGHWRDETITQCAAVAATQRLADLPAQGLAHRWLGRAYTRLGRYDDANTQLRLALHLFRRIGDLTGQAHTHYSLLSLWEQQGRHTNALEHAQRALDLYRAADHQGGLADALNAVGWLHAQLGNLHQALAYCQQALALHQKADDYDGQAETLDSLGYTHHQLGDHNHAIACYQGAIKLLRDLGDRYNEATILTRLGDTHHTAGDLRAARTAWQQALTILDQLDHPDAEQVHTKLATLDTHYLRARPRTR